MTSTDPATEIPALLWNGLIGIRIGRDGLQGGNLFAIDEYEMKGEEKILPLGDPLRIEFEDGEHHDLRPSQSSDYREQLDFRNGSLVSEWTHVANGHSLRIRRLIVLHPDNRILAERWVFQADRRASLHGYAWPKASESRVERVKGDGRLSIDSQLGPNHRPIQVAFSARGAQADGAAEVAISDPGISLRGGCEPGRDAVFERLFVLSPLKRPADRASANQVRTERPRSETTFDQVLAGSKRVWADRWKTDIEIDGPAEDQQAVRSFLFYLRSAIHPDGGMSISPFGLSNDIYNGHVFWDADMWVFPALAFVDPDVAKQIPMYRLPKMGAGREPFARGKNSDQIYAMSTLRFPWESSVSGKEVAPVRYRNGIHVSGDAAYMLMQAAALGLIDKRPGPVLYANPPLRGDEYYAIREVASFYRRLAAAQDGGRPGGPLNLRRVMGPDENREVDNDLYTNLLAQWCENGGTWDPKTPPRATYNLPHDGKTFLTYDNDPLRAYNQAAAVLAIYPLQYPPAEKEARQMMERFENKIAENGPAMSDSIHAVVWARLNEPERAYNAWRRSWQRYTNNPLMLFSERPKSGQTYFTTGAAGCLQSVIFGFLGFRIDTKPQPGAVWSKKLYGGRWLSVKPNLPKAWRSVTFRNFKVLGRTYTLTATQSGARVTQGDR